MPWDVVFWEDQTLSYVPTCWGNNDKTSYKFPNTKNENILRRYIHEGNDIISNFSWCAGTPKKTNITSLELAKQLCERGQYTSNLETDDQQDDDCYWTKSGRLKKKRKLSTSESSEASTNSETSSLTPELIIPQTENCEYKLYVFSKILILWYYIF